MNHKPALQAILNSTKRPTPALRLAFKNPLVVHNFVVLCAGVLEAAHRRNSPFRGIFSRWGLRMDVRLFSIEFFHKRFDADSKLEEQELARNRRVLRFFAHDFFYYDFRGRSLANVLQEDVFFNQVEEDACGATGDWLQKLYDDICAAPNEEGVRVSVDSFTRSVSQHGE